MLEDLDKKYKELQDELARIDNKSMGHLRSVVYYSTWILAILGILFSVSVYFINNSRTNAGSGIAWFAAFLTFVLLVGTFISLIEVLLEIKNRKK